MVGLFRYGIFTLFMVRNRDLDVGSHAEGLLFQADRRICIFDMIVKAI